MNQTDTTEIAKSGVADAPIQGTTAEMVARKGSIDIEKVNALTTAMSGSEESYDDTPTEEELATLRRVSGKINWAAFTIAFCELCERFSYYGSTVVFVCLFLSQIPIVPRAPC